MSENGLQLSQRGRGHKGALWDNDVPDWGYWLVFPPPDRWKTLPPGDEPNIPSDICRPTLEVEEVAATSAVWPTEGALRLLPSPGQLFHHLEKSGMGMGDVPRKHLVVAQQESTQTLRHVIFDGRRQVPTLHCTRDCTLLLLIQGAPLCTVKVAVSLSDTRMEENMSTSMITIINIMRWMISE